MFKTFMMVAVMLVLSAPAMATNFIGTGEVCKLFTVAGPGKTVACTPVVAPAQFLSEDSCRKHFEEYLVKTTTAAYVVNPNQQFNPEDTLQADGDKILLMKGTPTNAFTDFTGFVTYSCTLNRNEVAQ